MTIRPVAIQKAARIGSRDGCQRTSNRRSALIGHRAGSHVRGGLSDSVTLGSASADSVFRRQRGCRPRCRRLLLADRAVDRLAQEVGVAGVASGFLDEVQQNPAE